MIKIRYVFSVVFLISVVLGGNVFAKSQCLMTIDYPTAVVSILVQDNDYNLIKKVIDEQQLPFYLVKEYYGTWISKGVYGLNTKNLRYPNDYDYFPEKFVETSFEKGISYDTVIFLISDLFLLWPQEMYRLKLDILECEEKGIKTIGLNIHSSATEYAGDVFDSAIYKDIDEKMAEFKDILSELDYIIVYNQGEFCIPREVAYEKDIPIVTCESEEQLGTLLKRMFN